MDGDSRIDRWSRPLQSRRSTSGQIRNPDETFSISDISRDFTIFQSMHNLSRKNITVKILNWHTSESFKTFPVLIGYLR